MGFWDDAYKARIIAVDTETTGLDWCNDALLGFSVAFPEGERVRSAYVQANANAVEYLKGMLARPINVVMHNAIFDLNVLSVQGIQLHPQAKLIDTMVAAHMLNENDPIGLKPLATSLLGREMVELEDLIRQYGNTASIPHQVMAEYAARDAEVTLLLWGEFAPRLQEEGLFDLFRKVEMPNVRIIAGMEQRGIRFDVEAAKARGAETQESVDRLLGEIEAIIEDSGYAEYKEKIKRVPVTELVTLPGKKPKKMRVGYEEVITEIPVPINVNSIQQMCRLLYDHFGLEPPRGKRDVRKETLSMLSDRYPDLRILQALLEYRKVQKLLSTYYKPLVEKAERNDGILHTHFNPCGTVTGRSSSSDPNLQNAPHDTVFRDLFKARPGYKLEVGDLSQAELRVTAHESQDPLLLKAYREEIDIHTQTAEMLGVERRIAKTLNFGLLYGMGAPTLQMKLWTEAKVRVSVEEADDIKNRWYKLYAGITPWQERVRQIAREQGYVRNMFGRIRRLPHINSTDIKERSYAEREAVNFMIQSAVAHIVKVAKISFTAEVARLGGGCQLLLEVHDELVAESEEARAEEYRELLQRCLGEASSLCVPIPGEVGIGDSWASAKH